MLCAVLAVCCSYIVIAAAGCPKCVAPRVLLLNVVDALEVEGGVLRTVGLIVATLHGLDCVSN